MTPYAKRLRKQLTVANQKIADLREDLREANSVNRLQSDLIATLKARSILDRLAVSAEKPRDAARWATK